MRKRKHARADDPTISFRKQAVWLFPGVFLIHSLFVYAAHRPLVRTMSHDTAWLRHVVCARSRPFARHTPL